MLITPYAGAAGCWASIWAYFYRSIFFLTLLRVENECIYINIGTALPNFLLWSKIFQLPPFLRIFEILERTTKGKGGSTKKGGS